MTKILKSPSKYVQGADILQEIDKHLQGIGSSLLILISSSGMKRVGPLLDACFAGKDYAIHYEIFQGECSRSQIDRLAAAAKAYGAAAIVGIGGGKILDTAKAAAYSAGLPMVIVPTVASTDSPCSSLSVVYHDNGEFAQYLFLDRCPDIVLVDTAIIAKAPAKLLAAGMGDAMATYFEARACCASRSDNQLAGKSTHSACGLAAMCWQYLQQDGKQAKEAVELGLCTDAVETIIEVNTYMSSVGFESGGLAAAHALQKGFSFIPQLHEQYHGYKVAFCTLVQLVMEHAWKDIGPVLRFCADVQLPICFADMGFEEKSLELLKKAAEKACAPGSTIYHMPFPVTPQIVVDAMLEADSLGKTYKQTGRVPTAT